MDIDDKIRKIEALIAGTSIEGARIAAGLAKLRLQEKTAEQPLEYSIKTDGQWKKRLFMAICQKHGLHAFRYSGQKHTTVMVRVNKPFMEQVLWPEYVRHSQAFDELASEILNDLINKIHCVGDEVEVIDITP